ncbi:MAG TPA: hypothetical protein VFS29_03020 [Motilibacteraceae bacterium]|nr:hypothetical protein [Motilibacteraceae bacterium]
MGEFIAQLRQRVVDARAALEQAQAEGDDYAASVRLGELESLRQLAASHGVAVGTLDPLAAAS